MLLAVSSLTLLFRRFHGDPPVHGPAKRTQSLDVLKHLFHFALQSLPKRVERCSHYRTVVDQPTWSIRQLSSLHELSAQLVYLTESTKKEEDPNLKHVLSPCCMEFVTAGCLLQRWKEGRFATAVSCTLREKMRPRTAANCSTSDFDG